MAVSKKYLVVPGYVRSASDGEEHYIDAHTLMRLYGVRPDECFVRHPSFESHGLPKGLRILRPRYDGNYRL